ncbi:flagellar biosynthesis protein FlhB [Nitrospira defluvii]|nr:flagellar biosynthesis protein FlhB [Nitrospira defluvii]
MADDDQEKTEKATPKKREDARKKGNVPTSQDISSAALILVAVLVFKGFGGNLIVSLQGLMKRFFTSMTTNPITDTVFIGIMHDGMIGLFYILAPILGFLLLVSFMSVVLQHGILWTSEPITPQLSRLDPISGFKRIFSITALVNVMKTVLKFLVIGFVAYLVIREELPGVLSMGQDDGNILLLIGMKIARLILWCGLAIAIIAIADFGFQLWEHERKLRMSHQEIKEELKQAEGTPLVRSRIRSLQRDIARKRMMSDVPKADVVITNPTHLAVAMSYRPEEMGAPKVVAKGAGFVAQKIKEIAQEHHIPIVENKPLAQTLFRTVEIGREVPSKIYKAVAEILAYVYKLKGKRAAQG